MSVGAGWTCHQCKAVVPWGCTHHCPTTVYPSTSTPTPPQPVALDPVPTLTRIADLLERIALAMEAQCPE